MPGQIGKQPPLKSKSGFRGLQGFADYKEFINGALAMNTSSPTLDAMKSLQNQMKIAADARGQRNPCITMVS